MLVSTSIAGGGGALPGEGTAAPSGGLAVTGRRGETRAVGGTRRDQRLAKRAPISVASNKLLTRRRTSPGKRATMQTSRRETAQAVGMWE